SSSLGLSTTTVEIWIKARNPEGRLKVGSTVRVSAVAEKVPDALVIPVTAVLTGEEGRTTAMVVGADGRAHQRSVTTGIHQGGQVQITGGLHDGEKVVIAGAYGLPDNTKVRIETPDEKGESPRQEPAHKKASEIG